MAIVFVMDGRPRYESGYICKVDGTPVERHGVCASVVYLLPGTHSLSIRYRSPIEVGDGGASITVEPGRIYQVNASSLRTRNTGVISVMPMAQGARLTYRNIAPSLTSGSALADQEVPYAAN